MKKLLGETLIYGMGAILPRIITFLLTPLYLSYIDKEENAQFANLYAWVAFVNILLTFGFETSFFRFSADKDNEQKTFSTSFWFIAGLSTVFLALVLIFSEPISVWLDYAENPEYIRWFAGIAFLDAIAVIPMAWLRFHGKAVSYSLIRIISIVVQTVFVILLFRQLIPKDIVELLGMGTPVSYPFFTNLAASALTLVMLLPVLLRVRFSVSTELLKKMLPYSWPVLIAGFAFMINEHYDKLVQYFNIPKGDAGAYAGCYKLAVLMTLFVTAYRMGIEPYFFKQMNSADAKKKYAQITEYFSLFASVVAMGLIANISWLKALFISDKAYWLAIDIVPIIILANLCFGIYYNLSTWYKVTDKTIYGTVISWIGAGITVLLHFLFLKKYGFMVSAWTTFAAYFVMMVLSYFLGQKHYPIPYRTKKIVWILSVLMVFAFIEVKILDYSIFWGNLMFLIFTGIIIYGERNFLISFLRKKRL